MKWLIIALIAVALIIFVLFGVSALIYKFSFGRRFDKGRKIKYFTPEEFGLNAEPISVKSGKYTLRGYIYRNEKTADSGKTVIFCHGMGPGQAAYTTEIAYFCKLGHTVVALDNFGCCLSDGKGVSGFYGGVKTAVCAIDFARADSRLADRAIYLVGHSWGAYSALCASAKRKVAGTVAISAPDRPVSILVAMVGAATKGFAKILYPFLWVISFLKFGANGNLSAAKCAKKSGTPALVIHGGRDLSVGLKYSAYSACNSANVKKLFCETKGHNPYNPENAERLLGELQHAISTAAQMPPQARDEYFDNFDFAAATEEDMTVMTAISDFINSCAK